MYVNIQDASLDSLDSLLAARNETLAFARKYDREFVALSESDRQCRCSEINPDPVYSCHIPCDRCAILRNAREEWDLLQTIEDKILSLLSL